MGPNRAPLFPSDSAVRLPVAAAPRAELDAQATAVADWEIGRYLEALRRRILVGMTDANRLAELRAEARHARERLDLYRAKVYGPRATSLTRLRELERVSEAAQDRLQAAERERP
jgi:hypothetical protein